jgi:hypothetical protein
VAVTADREPPSPRDTPLTAAEPGTPLAIAAEDDRSGVKSVRVGHRGLTEHQGFRTLEMLPPGQGTSSMTKIPGAHVDLESETLYVVVPVRR